MLRCRYLMSIGFNVVRIYWLNKVLRPAAVPYFKWLYRGVRTKQRARHVLSTSLDDVLPTWLYRGLHKAVLYQ